MTAPSSAPSASRGPGRRRSECLPGGAGRRPALPPFRIPAVRFARRGAAACLLGLALLLGFAAPAQAQTSVTLVSNTGQSADGASTFAVARAQAFTTGSNTQGYKLTSVTFPILGNVSTGTTVRIESSGTDNKPGGSLGTLTLSWTAQTVTGTTTGIDLDANTTYFVVLGGGDIGATYDRTDSNSEDAGAATGWSIGDNSFWGGGNWDSTSTTSWQIAIHGYAKAAAPTFGSASVNGAALTVTFDVPRDPGFPLDPGFKGRWAVDVDGTVAGAAADTLSGNTLTLTLATPVRHGQTVKLLYVADAATAIRDTSGERMAPWSDGFRAVRNVTPSGGGTPPSVSGATVNGKVLNLTFEWALDAGSVPAPRAFDVMAGGRPLSPSGSRARAVVSGGVAIAGATVRLTLTSAVEPGHDVWVRYAAPSASPLRDTSGTAVASFSSRRAVNHTPYPATPTVRDGRVRIPFDRPITGCPNTRAFTVKALSRATGTKATLDAYHNRCGSRSVTLWLRYDRSDDYDWREATVSYDQTKATTYYTGTANASYGSRLKYADDNSAVPNFTDVALTRLTPVDWSSPWLRLPELRRAEVEGSTLTLAFAADLNPGSRPPGGAFAVRAPGLDGAATGVGVARIDGATVTVHLNAAVPAGTASMTYTPPKRNPLLDLIGYQIRAISLPSIPVHGDTTPPVLSGASVNGETLVLAFDEMLDADSAPAPGAFRVTVGGARRNVAAGGVAVDGASVRLTLASAVTRADTVRVRYARGQSPLRDLSGNAAAGFAEEADNRTPDRPGDGGPSFRSASVNGETLTVTFDETLDADSVPALGAFRVSVDGARRSVAAGGVAIDGASVTLTLASAVESGETVTVGYTAPSANPLQDADGNAAARFTGVPVANVPEAGALANAGPSFQSAAVSQKSLRVTFDEPLDESAPPPADSFTVKVTPDGGSRAQTPTATVERQGHSVAGTGTTSVDGATVTVPLARPVPPGWKVTVSYARPGANPVRGRSGALAQAFSRKAASNAPPARAPTGVSVVSDAGSDKTYGGGEKIEVRVTFDGPVDVTGTPRLKIDMDPADWGEKWAAYDRGSGTSGLTFVHTVAEPNLSTQGVAVLANTLELNGGTIRADGVDAELAHTGLGHDSNHKVDWQAEPEGSGPIAPEHGLRPDGDGGVGGLEPGVGRHLHAGRDHPHPGDVRPGGAGDRQPPPLHRHGPGTLGHEAGGLREGRRHGHPGLRPHGGGAELLDPGHRGAGRTRWRSTEGRSARRTRTRTRCSATPASATTPPTRWTGARRSRWRTRGRTRARARRSRSR